jgi:branched-subunit amino acid aminotransferase/4-amino-4-deoxychorismate lyase
VETNFALMDQGDDLGLSLFVTPGEGGGGPPSMGIYTYPLAFGQWAELYEHGQALVETGVRQIPSSCWPAELKCRSRMHYYLADRLAAQVDPSARAILLDQDGLVSEASTANVVIYRAGIGFVSPPLRKILPGVSLSVLSELATSLAIDFHYDDIQLQQVAAAEEVFLCSTSPCIWPVVRLNGEPIGSGVPGPMFQRVLSAWSHEVGIDIQGQAQRFAWRR